MTTRTHEFQNLSKSKLLFYRQRPKRLWLATYRKDLCKTDEYTNSRLQTSIQIGEVPRPKQPDGLLIEDDDFARALGPRYKHFLPRIVVPCSRRHSGMRTL